MAIVFHITDAGKTASLNAENLGVELKLKYIAVGTGQYDQGFATKEALTNEVERFVLNGGNANIESHTLRIVASIDATVIGDYFEIGLFTEDNVLFAVASTTTSTPLISLYNEITVVITIGVVLDDIKAENVIVSLDVNTPISIELMNQHLGHTNPHPQYVLNSALQHALNALQLAISTSMQEHLNEEDPHPQYATKLQLLEARNQLLEGMLIHATASNPHPQYLLASTFGVSLPMTANVDGEYTNDNQVIGWTGDGGNAGYHPTESWSWGTQGGGTLTFAPWRAYGDFLLAIEVKDMDIIKLYYRVFDKNKIIIDDGTIIEYQGGGHSEIFKRIMNIPKDGYLEFEWWLKSSYKKKGRMWTNIYVDDRAKIFKPVGYQSIVDSADAFDSESVDHQDDYSMYPNAEWFYYSATLSVYVSLESNNTLESPVNFVPHYHRLNFENLRNTEVYVLIEVGIQSTANDYVKIQTEYVNGAVDSNGDVVVTIPFDFRTVSPEAGFKLVYTVIYYATAVEKIGNDFPPDAISPHRQIFVNRT